MSSSGKNHTLKQEIIEYTGRKNDVAINGDGFFIVIESETGFRKYTRKGSFDLTNKFELAMGTGEVIQGWNVDIITGKIDTSKDIETIKIELKSEIDSPETSFTKVLKNYRISENGVINGYFSNNTVQEIAQIAIAIPHFFSEFEKQDAIFYFETENSETPDIVIPGNNNDVKLYGESLESTNYNISKELVEMMITYQNKKKEWE